MLDIVPGGRTGDDTSWGRELSQRQKRAQARHTIEAPRVVKLTNKLPARLRRPVHDELERQRRRRRVRDAIVRFERRPLYSEVPSDYPRYARAQPAPAPLPNGELHTGDVYMQSRPQVNLPVPPYAGTFVGRKVSPAARPTRRPAPRSATSMAQPRRVVSLPPSPRVIATAPRPERQVLPPVPSPVSPPAVAAAPPRQQVLDRHVRVDSVEKDPQQGVVQPPRRRFALPLHFSIFPLSLWPRRDREQPLEARIVSAEERDTRKKKLLLG